MGIISIKCISLSLEEKIIINDPKLAARNIHGMTHKEDQLDLKESFNCN